MEIIPAILTDDAEDFKARLLHPELRRRAKLFHVDILDGSLFQTTCWTNPAVIRTWPNLPDIELHAMVYHPLRLVRDWEGIPVRRIIIHIEIGEHLKAIVPQLKERGLEVVLAVNPRTVIDTVNDFGLPIDGLQIMGVEPGKSGQAFLGEPILSKLRRAQALFPNLPISIDGGVRPELVGDLIAAGADRIVAASALWKAVDPGEAFDELVARTH